MPACAPALGCETTTHTGKHSIELKLYFARVTRIKFSNLFGYLRSACVWCAVRVVSLGGCVENYGFHFARSHSHGVEYTTINNLWNHSWLGVHMFVVAFNAFHTQIPNPYCPQNSLYRRRCVNQSQFTIHIWLTNVLPFFSNVFSDSCALVRNIGRLKSPLAHQSSHVSNHLIRPTVSNARVQVIQHNRLSVSMLFSSKTFFSL